MKHAWSFFGAAEGGHRYVISLCPVCGEARYVTVETSGERKLDLTGLCPGEQEAPPERPSTRGRFATHT